MKKTGFQQLAFGLALSFWLLGTAHAGWVATGSHKAGPPALETVRSDSSGMVIDLDIPGLQITETLRDGMVYHGISVPGGGRLSGIGKPALPFVGRYVAVPQGATVSVRVMDARFEEMTGYNVVPAQAPLPESNTADGRPFEKDRAAYGENGFFPGQVAQLEAPVSIRGCATSLLRLFPVQFNPVSQTLRVYSRITVQVTFDGGTRRFIDRRKHSRSLAPVFDNLFLNAPLEMDSPPLTKADDRSVTAKSATDGAALLLIVSPPELVAAADRLSNWKRAQGIVTEVRTTAQTGTTAADIQGFIQNAYDTWPVPPSYVLLVGDVEFIPTHRGDGSGTDLYYATVDGDDYFPDLSLGRLSVDTLDQAIKRVEDIIRYELSPPEQESFYQKAAIVAYFQDNDFDDMADRRFVQSAEDMALFFSDPAYLDDDDYDVDRIYYAGSRVDPLTWNNDPDPDDRTSSDDPWNFGTTGVLSGGPGDTIPDYLLRSRGFAWDGDAVDISTAVNAGRFLVAYRGHGQTSRWDSVTYTTSDVFGLTNQDLLPVVFSVTCLSGKFDMESSGNNTPCFSESWERNPNGGAVGILAASETTYSGHNDRLFWGWMEALWPDFPEDYHPSDTPFDQPAWEMGPVFNYGKYYYATWYEEDRYRKLEFERFHWFGDPTMRLWTTIPQDLAVSGYAIDAGSGGLEIDVGQAGAVICVSRDGLILGKGVSTGGTDLVACDPSLAADDAILVVVTKPNFRPFVAVTEEDGDALDTMLEILTGTSPHDADTDDDGIADDVEVNEEATDPRNIDTDGDGIQDGTEKGRTLADVHDDTDLTIFQPDEDPSTTTDPLDSDTDGDCAFDGQEDTNANGRLDDDETDPNVYDNLAPPVANAGSDQSAREGTTVRLDGTGSYDACQTLLSFFWEQLSGPAVTLSGATTSRPTFAAPTVGSAGTALVFRLTVDDGDFFDTDTCQVTVTDTPPPPEGDDDDDDDDGPAVPEGGGGGGGGCFIGAALPLK